MVADKMGPQEAFCSAGGILSEPEPEYRFHSGVNHGLNKKSYTPTTHGHKSQALPVSEPDSSSPRRCLKEPMVVCSKLAGLGTLTPFPLSL